MWAAVADSWELSLDPPEIRLNGEPEEPALEDALREARNRAEEDPGD